MLEIKNLTKIYKTKGDEVKALDNVSLSFAHTGLVFILGKSGCGKSTLLNLIGGLDEPSDGEIVLMGKSSKEFSASDFDSYRNTYVGIIFQEYNILNEFNVEDNISLALELQGKKKDAARVKEILDEVGLTEFAKRKPNTLSGGQKQRIAIARALVKDPQIIMADEPTGALDSVTGRQVLETLKKLSERRLVIVVSHDREFASTFGDRIIELKDGVVISDVSKIKVDATELSPSVIMHGEDTITVSGTPDEDTMKLITEFIAGGDVLISRNKSDISTFKRVNKIDENGAREDFVPTVQPEDEGAQEVKFLKSKLPLERAVKIGASGLKLKPLRLFLTILLSFFSFVMFGLFSTVLFYDENTAITESIYRSDYENLIITKKYAVTTEYPNDISEVEYRSALFEDKDLDYFGGAGIRAYNGNSVTPRNIVGRSAYYMPTINKFAVVNKNIPNIGFYGSYPTSYDEIAVSSYFLQCAENMDFYKFQGEDLEKEPTKITSAQDLINKEIEFFDEKFVITGVFDSGEISNKYDLLKDSNPDSITALTYEIYLDESLHTLAFVSDRFVEHFKGSKIGQANKYYDSFFDKAEESLVLYPEGTKNMFLYLTREVSVYNERMNLPLYLFSDNDGIIVPFSALKDRADLGIDLNATPELASAFETLIASDYGTDSTTLLERKKAAETVTNYIKEQHKPIMVDYYTCKTPRLSDLTMQGKREIVGAYIDTVCLSPGFFLPQSDYDNLTVEKRGRTYTKYVQGETADAEILLIPRPASKAEIGKLVDKLKKVNESDELFVLENAISNEAESATMIVENLSTLFLWVGVVLALFASLMLFNFISVSISSKKREIGILRAVGARGIDVFKIFFAESLLIVGICIVLSFIGTVIAATIFNHSLKTMMGLELVIFVIGPMTVVLLIAVALIVAFISTFLPVYFAAKKKPVDSIRAL